MLPFFLKFFPAMKSFNWGHFAAYFILALTFYWGLGKKYANLKGKILVIGLCVAYGITDEYHQSFIAGRHPDPVDLRNDAIGALLAMIVLSIPPFKTIYLRSRKY
jgi:VanZ family protein